MTPVEQRHVDRVLAVIDALKDTAKSLETLHEIDASRAIAYLEKSPPLQNTSSFPDLLSERDRVGLASRLLD
jgi:hypothetical protein